MSFKFVLQHENGTPHASREPKILDVQLKYRFASQSAKNILVLVSRTHQKQVLIHRKECRCRSIPNSFGCSRWDFVGQGLPCSGVWSSASHAKPDFWSILCLSGWTLKHPSQSLTTTAVSAILSTKSGFDVILFHSSYLCSVTLTKDNRNVFSLNEPTQPVNPFKKNRAIKLSTSRANPKVLPIRNVTDPDTMKTNAGSYSKLDVKLLKTFFSLSAQMPTDRKQIPQT